jgi:hypothetical protein
MKKILVVVTAIAVAAISYGSLAALWSASDPTCNTECLTAVGPNGIGADCSRPSGVFYLCEDDTSTDEAPAEEGKPDEPVPSIDRTWNVVMYG